MTNEELVNNIVCKNCRGNTCEMTCSTFNKEYCFIYNSALQVANEKDKQLQQYVENEVKNWENQEEYIQHFDNS